MNSKNERHYSHILAVSNYASGTAYAWWLMGFFWKLIEEKAGQDGRKFTLVFPKIEEPVLENGAAAANCQQFPFSVTGLGLLRTARFIRRASIDVLYLTDYPFYSLAYAVFRLAGVKTIIVHDHTPGDRISASGLRRYFKRLRSRISWLNASYFLSVSDLMGIRAIDSTCVPSSRSRVIQNGIVPIDLPDEIIRKRALEEMGCTSDTFVLVTSGRLHPYKRPLFALRAFAEFIRQRPEIDAVLVFVGDGEERESILEYASRENIRNVRLLGARKDVRLLLAGARAAIHCALGEGFSLSILEYMSAGLPVVLPKIPSVIQADPEQLCTVHFDPADIGAAAAAIQFIYDNPNKAAEMSMQARQLVEEKYDLRRTAAEFRDFLNCSLA